MSAAIGFSSCQILIFSLLWLSCYGAIQDKLKYHEVVNIQHSHVRNKRSVDTGIEFLTKEFSFHAFNRTFTCVLTPRLNLFSPTFKLVVYGANGEPEEHSFRRDQIYNGKCAGDDSSEIRGTFKDGIFSGSVKYEGQLYGVEDASYHIQDETSTGQMLVYRASDIKWPETNNKSGHGPGFCGNFHQNVSFSSSKNDDVIASAYQGSRFRRSTPTWNTCKIITVADYNFFQKTGRGDIRYTATYMAGTIDRVDAIYRNTEFTVNSAIQGLGFEIAQMVIYKSATTGFNKLTTKWEPLDLLESFSENLEYKNFCAAHLFTHQAFDGNILGLAYIAPPREGGVGGICSPAARLKNVMSSLNTGWSSNLNQNHDTVLLQQADLVTAHGHNWGAEHDPETGDCSPSTVFNKGKYLMYPYSVSGYDSNNYMFSPCSKALISAVLKIKGSTCLKERSEDQNQICGNGRIDVGEECDAGFLSKFNLDDCCDKNCRLVAGAVCSPSNHECCTSCKVSPAGTTCRANTDIDCLESAFCDGYSLTCPAQLNKLDGSSCLDKGQCQNGQCVPFCTARNLTACACEKMAESCFRCCRENATMPCKLYSTDYPLPDGRPCVGGYCQNSKCISSSKSTIQRLFQILENLSIDTIATFFRNNMVGCVIVFSLLLWFPASIAVWCHDRKERKKSDKNYALEICPKRTRTLLFDQDGRKVVKPVPAPSTGNTALRFRALNASALNQSTSAL
ncbi:ADAM 17-like protease [Physella acuta]|uniref:ADAM 17-like protease n=1 Tax=Physella acuta TaxID=109671 RepID=UPI0027DB3B47|nr:ADAM 17-like protease [Physella acuta]